MMSKVAANTKFFLLTMFLTTALASQTARAQQDSAPVSEQEAENGAAAIEAAQEDTAQLEREDREYREDQEELDEPEESEESEQPEESEARFIPSEEISRGKGVAFPVDI
jgi:hypothetical protein